MRAGTPPASDYTSAFLVPKPLLSEHCVNSGAPRIEALPSRPPMSPRVDRDLGHLHELEEDLSKDDVCIDAGIATRPLQVGTASVLLVARRGLPGDPGLLRDRRVRVA